MRLVSRPPFGSVRNIEVSVALPKDAETLAFEVSLQQTNSHLAATTQRCEADVFVRSCNRGVPKPQP
jgi:hypothetical protein